jgi:hypothetical protein
MAVIYVARSERLAEWGAEVGLTKHIYKVGLVDDSAEAVPQALNDTAHAGETDWKLVKKQAVEGADEAAAIERLSRREKMVDPVFYPRIKGARGIFKVKVPNVENFWLVRRALEGQETKTFKVKPTDIAGYLIENALN